MKYVMKYKKTLVLLKIKTPILKFCFRSTCLSSHLTKYISITES